MTRTEEFEEQRPLLFSIAYRILGSVSGTGLGSGDLAALRGLPDATRTSIKAFLSAAVARISIDVLRSARRRRKEYLGQWFPEPLLTDPYEGPS